MLSRIRDLKFWQKLLLLIVAQSVPLAFAVWSFNASLQRTIHTTEVKLFGLDYAEPLADLASVISEHQIAATARAAGSDAFNEHGATVLAEGMELIQVVAQQHATNGAELQVAGEYDALLAAWTTLLAAKDSRDPAVIGRVHGEALAAATTLRQLVEQSSGLAMDPGPGTSNLIGIAVSGVADLFAAGGSVARALETLRREGPGSYEARRALSSEEGQVLEELKSITDHLEAAIAAEPQLAGKFDAGFTKMQENWTGTLTGIRPLVESDEIGARQIEAFAGRLLDAFRSVHEVHDPISDQLRAMFDARLAAQTFARNKLMAILLAALVVVVLLSWWMSRELGQRLNRAAIVLKAIAGGDLSVEVVADAKDEIGSILGEIGTTRERLRAQLDAERRVAAENLRIRQALDAASSAVMVADTDGNIIFVNRTAERLFANMERDLQRQWPQFQAKKIVGSNIDIFHAQPSHQRNLLKGLKGSHSAHVPLAGRRMQLGIYPVQDAEGVVSGFAIEWLDRTAETRTEQDVERVISAAIDGDLAQRLALEGKQGFFASLCKQINTLLDVNQRVFDDLGRVLNSLAQGRLTEKVTTDYKGTYARIRDDINLTVEKLVNVVEQIQMSSDIVNSSAMQLAGGNDNLSRRTTEQAASLEETAASIEELTSTVRHNADNASQANQLATATRGLAEKGGEVVTRAVAAMGAINTSSRQIADIISVIDDIAFQTNLLALNAAVEAARAGEQGRGFAVVAAEVRTLARRSAESAKEIKSLIQDSVAKVDNGSQLVDESGRTLDEIVGSVKRVTDLIAEITAASREQATGVDEINKAVTQMDQVTTQNAALVDEASAGTHALAEQARALAQVVAFFDLGSARRKAVPAPAPPPATRPAASAEAAIAVNAVRPAPAKRAAPPASRPVSVVATSAAGDDWDTF
jgi:methyl-accepting chemotaxis protein